MNLSLTFATVVVAEKFRFRRLGLMDNHVKWRHLEGT